MPKPWKQRKRQGNPWMHTWTAINQRCNNPNNPKYKRYGGRGIKVKITKADLQFLWYRDLAVMMKRPSIDRINNNGHYTLKNCRYIELGANTKRQFKSITHCPKGHPYSGKNLQMLPSEPNCRRCLTCRSAARKVWRHKIAADKVRQAEEARK